MQSELVISKNCNSLLASHIINLEWDALSNAQYTRREMLEINPVPHSINNVDLEGKVYKALSLTGTKATASWNIVHHHLHILKIRVNNHHI